MSGDKKFVLSPNKRFDLIALLACLGLALAFRLPGLTVFLTADEPRSWFGRSIIFLDSLTRGDWANTAPGGTAPFIENVSLSPAPGVTTMWTGAIGIILEYWRQGAPGSLSQFLVAIPFDPLDPAMLFSLRLPGVLIAVGAVGLTYWWSRSLLGRWGALLTASLIALDPFYLALSRVLGHDAPVTTFMWLSLLAFLRAIGNRRTPGATVGQYPAGSHFSFLILSGALAGLAFLSKYPALFIGAFIALAMLIVYLLETRSSPVPHSPAQIRNALGRWVRDMALWSTAAGLVFVLFWPAMWVNPPGPLAAMINDALRASASTHQKGSFFLGQPVSDPGSLFYPVVALLRTTPVILFGLLVSLWLLLRRTANTLPGSPTGRQQALPTVAGLRTAKPPGGAGLRTHYATILVLLAYILLYALLITYGGKKQDRYLLPAFPALTMLATIGYLQLLRFTSHFKWLLPVAILLLQVVLVLPYYPYYFSYYNPLVRGSAMAAGTIQVGWGEGLNEAAAYLNTLPGAESAKVVSWYSTTFEPYFAGQAIYKIEDEKISRSSKPGLAADYVVFYVNQIQRRLPSEGTLAYFQRAEPIYIVSLGGQEYAWIYPAPGVSHIIGGEARLVGQAELLGFDWLDAKGQRLTVVPSGSVTTLRLYWEWQGKASADPIRISLIDGQGHTWGWAHLESEGVPTGAQAEEQGIRREGEIVVSDYAMAIFPGTPPGQYYLNAWIDRPDTGELVGQFPLAADDVGVTVAPALIPPGPDDFEIRTRLDGSFGALQLLGYNLADGVWEPGEQRSLELFWAMPPQSKLQQDALAKLLLVPHSPHAKTQYPRWERGLTPSYPTTRWQPGDHFRDVWPLVLPRHVPRGRYDLQLTVNNIALTIGQVEVGGRERLFERPNISSPLDVTIGDSIKLLGYNLKSAIRNPKPVLRPSGSPTGRLRTAEGSEIALTLFWQAIDIPAQDYTVFVQLLDAGNQIVAQQDSQPQNGAAPTGTWAVGEIVPDQYTLSFDFPKDRVTYRLITGLYRPETGGRLPIVTENGKSAALTLTTLEIE